MSIELTLNPNGDGNYVLYYTNASGDRTWETLANWNTAADGSGDNPTEVPWSGTDGSTSGYDLVDASGGAGVSINSNIDPNGDVTGVCSIPSITNYATINGGTFSGSGFTNYYGTINGGTFSGSGFTNNGGNTTINGGTFSGDGFTNYSNATINGGTFSGDGFTNTYSATITGGTFTGSGFTNTYSATITGGTFTGSGADPYPMFALGIFTGGYNGYYYTNGQYDEGFSGFDGSTPYSQGYIVTGGFDSQYYTNGIEDNSFTGTATDYDPANGFITKYYVNGGAFTGGYNGIYYTNGLQDSSFTGGYNGIYYTSGAADTTFNGSTYDSYLNETLPFIGGVAVIFPPAAQVQSGVSFGLYSSLQTGTLVATSTIPPAWDNGTYYAQNSVVSFSDKLWVLSNTAGWTVGGAPGVGSGYGWTQLSTGTGGSVSSGINIGQLIGLPAFIQL